MQIKCQEPAVTDGWCAGPEAFSDIQLCQVVLEHIRNNANSSVCGIVKRLSPFYYTTANKGMGSSGQILNEEWYSKCIKNLI